MAELQQPLISSQYHYDPKNKDAHILWPVLLFVLLSTGFPPFFLILWNELLTSTQIIGFAVVIFVLYLALLLHAVLYFNLRTFCSKPQFYSNVTHFVATTCAYAGCICFFNAAYYDPNIGYWIGASFLYVLGFTQFFSCFYQHTHLPDCELLDEEQDLNLYTIQLILGWIHVLVSITLITFLLVL